MLCIAAAVSCCIKICEKKKIIKTRPFSGGPLRGGVQRGRAYSFRRNRLPDRSDLLLRHRRRKKNPKQIRWRRLRRWSGEWEEEQYNIRVCVCDFYSFFNRPTNASVFPRYFVVFVFVQSVPIWLYILVYLHSYVIHPPPLLLPFSWRHVADDNDVDESRVDGRTWPRVRIKPTVRLHETFEWTIRRRPGHTWLKILAIIIIIIGMQYVYRVIVILILINVIRKCEEIETSVYFERRVARGKKLINKRAYELIQGGNFCT